VGGRFGCSEELDARESDAEATITPFNKIEDESKWITLFKAICASLGSEQDELLKQMQVAKFLP